jgi:poly(3-hydroxybutyrate) depolymerase
LRWLKCRIPVAGRIMHGMGHFWPGGTTDPEYANFTDPKGPSGAKASWAFFRRYSRSDTAMPCAEDA